MHDTDKITHKLIPEYERMFGHLQDEPINILEVGIYQGASLLWMADYFPKATILGMDIAIPKLEHPRINLIKANQNDSEALKEIGKAYGPFHLIIDDGCHQAIETKNTFDNLWPFVASGGNYVIEDFIAGYWNKANFGGMPRVVADIMVGKNDLGISDFEIILREPKCSLARFSKNS